MCAMPNSDAESAVLEDYSTKLLLRHRGSERRSVLVAGKLSAQSVHNLNAFGVTCIAVLQ